MNRFFRGSQRGLMVAVGVLILVVMATGEVRAQNCDRVCLKGMITQYLDALAAHPARRYLGRARLGVWIDALTFVWIIGTGSKLVPAC